MPQEGTGLELCLLGPFLLRSCGGRRIPITSTKAMALLAMLAVAPGGARTRAWLQDKLWGSRQRAQAQASLRRELSNLRRCVRDGREALIEADHTWARLDLTRIAVDVRSLRSGQESANHVSRGDFLEGIDVPGEEGFEDWLREQRLHFARSSSGLLAASDRSGSEPKSRATRGSHHPAEEPASRQPNLVDLEPAVAVLPFLGLQSDYDCEWLRDGIADDVILALGSAGSFPVIARQSSFAPALVGKSARQISDALAAPYLVEGTVHIDRGRLRLNIRLVEGQSGRQIWGNRFECSRLQLLEARDQVSKEIAGAITSELDAFEQRRAAALPPANLDAYLTVQKGRWYHFQLTRPDNLRAQELFREAIAAWPSDARPHAALSVSTYAAAFNGWMADRDSGLALARKVAASAVERDRNSAEGWFALGAAEQLLYRIDASADALTEATRLNPSFAAAHAQLAFAHVFSGLLDRAVSSVELAIRLSPRDPRMHVWLPALAMARYQAGEYEGAIAAARRQTMIHPTYPIGYYYLAAALAQLGHRKEAGVAMDQLISLRPDALDRMARTAKAYKDPAMGRHILDGLHRAAADARRP